MCARAMEETQRTESRPETARGNGTQEIQPQIYSNSRTCATGWAGRNQARKSLPPPLNCDWRSDSVSLLRPVPSCRDHMTRYAQSLLFSLTVAGCMLAATPAWGQQTSLEGDRILGEWLTAEGKARITLSRTDDRYSGKIVWLKEPEKNGRPAVDDQNSDERLRGRPILGMEMVYGFVYDGDGVWVDGRVYDPESGDEYRGKLRLVDENTMELRGYILIPLLGRTETWTRVK